MANDRRSLLRRQLLKEQLANEAPETPHQAVEEPVTVPSQSYPVEAVAPEEMQSEGSKELDAGLAGAAQGATFGFSDELGAAKDVAGDYLTGNPLGKKYREYQKLREAENKRLSDESPWAYTGGELAGGVASALVTPGIGTAKIAGTAGRLSPAVGKFLAGQGEGALNRIAGKGIAAAIEGAPIGAAYGLGTSEHDFAQPAELAMDTAAGAGMGSLGGLAIGASAQVGKEAFNKAASMAKDSNLLRQVGEGYNMGKEGINLASGETQEQLSLLPNEKAKGFVDRIMATDKEIGKKVGASIDKAQDSGVTINVDPKIQSVSEKIFKTLFTDNPTLGEFVDPKSTQVLKLIASREKGDLTPIEARSLKDELYRLTDNLAGLNSDTANFARKMGMDLAKELDVSMKLHIPDYQTAAREFEAFRRMVPETIMGKGTPAEYGKVYMGDLKNPELKLFESSRELMKKSQMPGETASAEKSTFQQLKNNFGELEKSNPDAMKTMGGSAKDVIGGLRKDSDRLATVRLSQGIDPHAGPMEAGKGALSGLSTAGRGVLVSGSNQLGRAAGAIEKSAPVKMARALFEVSNDGLQGLANRLKSQQSTALLGQALENSLTQKNDAAKNAVLFKLMQNPEYRNLLREEGLSEESVEQ